MEKQRILVVEDEISINDILTFSLRKEGYEVRGVYKGQDAIDMIDGFKPDLVLLDVMLPDKDGFQVCREICDKTFVIMLTARNDVIDKILGIEIGADDYITKPFEIREITARIKGVFRRVNKQEKFMSIISEEIKEGELVINLNDRKVYKDGKEVLLKKKEFDLLRFLYSNKNIVFSREELLDKVWGDDFEGDLRTVDVHIRRVRAKLGEEKNSTLIETVFGVGYVMRWSLWLKL